MRLQSASTSASHDYASATRPTQRTAAAAVRIRRTPGPLDFDFDLLDDAGRRDRSDPASNLELSHQALLACAPRSCPQPSRRDRRFPPTSCVGATDDPSRALGVQRAARPNHRRDEILRDLTNDPTSPFSSASSPASIVSLPIPADSASS